MDVDGKVEGQFDKQVLKNNDVLGRVRKASPTEVVSNKDHVSCWRFWRGAGLENEDKYKHAMTL